MKFRSKIILIVLSILSLGYFGTSLINKNYQQVINLVVSHNDDQSKITNINRGFLRFVIYDEKSFSDVSSNSVNVDSVIKWLDFYKNDFLSDCDDTDINKKLIDSLTQRKFCLLKQFGEISSKHINVNKLYTTDTTLKAFRFIGKSKVSYNIDPKKLKHDITIFDHNRNAQLNDIIFENFRINYLISLEVHKYVDTIKHNMSKGGDNIINEVSHSINRFIIYIVVILFIILLLISSLIKKIKEGQ